GRASPHIPEFALFAQVTGGRVADEDLVREQFPELHSATNLPAMLVDAHAGVLEKPGDREHSFVHAQITARVQKTGTDGFAIGAEANVEECPSSEIAGGHGADGRAARQVLILGLTHDAAIWFQFLEGGNGFGENRDEILDRDVSGMKWVQTLL